MKEREQHGAVVPTTALTLLLDDRCVVWEGA